MVVKRIRLPASHDSLPSHRECLFDHWRHGGWHEDNRPYEIRVTSVQNGETRHLVPGDVIVIHNGVPHWFKEVQGSFDYYVVKVC